MTPLLPRTAHCFVLHTENGVVLDLDCSATHAITPAVLYAYAACYCTLHMYSELLSYYSCEWCVLLPCALLAADLEPTEISPKDPIHEPVTRRVRHTRAVPHAESETYQ